MKYMRFILILIAVIAIFLAYFFFAVNRDISKRASDSQQQTDKSSFETKTDEQGQVSIKITPQTFSGSQWKFDVVLDTHSVDLNQDLTQIAELIDDKGGVYKPIAWEGSAPGGHHREGVLAFEGISPSSLFVELKIKNVGDVPERLFKWDL